MSAPSSMSSSASTASSDPPKKRGRLSNFWFRISEGRAIDDLWSQFVADAHASYGFYGKDVDWEEVEKLSHWRRPFHIARQFFWALMMKLSPARRVLLVIALVLLVLSGFGVHLSDSIVFDTRTEAVVAVLLV